jgi:threonine aldolase
MTHWIDLRSDTVTLPTPAMRDAMAKAEVGDDVYGEDPTINRLQQVLAELAGTEAGLFLPSATQSNLVALLTHCDRGDEYLVGSEAHCYQFEAGGAAVLGGIQPFPMALDENGRLDLEKVRAAVKPDDPHFPRTRLLALENTWNGRVLPLDYLAEMRELARCHELKLHLDGARVFNAAVALGCELSEITRYADSVSVCLSKGLGAPVGAVLLGSREFIRAALRWRKITGGGMRQAGILAAAGLYALTHHVDRLAEDHRRAKRLAEGLREAGHEVEEPQTNMVFVWLTRTSREEFTARLAAHNIRADFHFPSRARMVTHLDISDEDIEAVIRALTP